jgi:uncharacterized membrane protein
MNQAWLAILMRYLHIVSAVLAVGGMAFISLCLQPSVRLLEDNLRASVMKLVLRRFNFVVLAAVGGLVVSGTYNWVVLAPTYKEMGARGNMLIGVKVLLAVAIFAVVFARTFGIIKPTRFWHMFNLHLAAVVILLAAVLRYFRLEYLQSLIHGR